MLNIKQYIQDKTFGNFGSWTWLCPEDGWRVMIKHPVPSKAVVPFHAAIVALCFGALGIAKSLPSTNTQTAEMLFIFEDALRSF